MKILQEYVTDAETRKKLTQYLEPFETQALFILGNFRTQSHPTELYVAYHNQAIVGVCCHYPTYNSASIFATSEEASRGFGKLLCHNTTISTLLGIECMAQPAYKEFLAAGRKPTNTPEQVFLELPLKNFRPFYSKEGTVHAVTEKDVPAVVLLHRYLHHIPQNLPITDNDRKKVLASPANFCLELDGKIVAIASSNGLAITAFQLLGVVTDPAFRGRGFAKAVCSHLIAHMQTLGAKKAVLFTGNDNTPAIRCYESLGFTITDTYCMGQFEAIIS